LNFHIETGAKGITIHRERRATKEEKAKDLEAKGMVEVIHITWETPTSEPKVIVNRDLYA